MFERQSKLRNDQLSSPQEMLFNQGRTVFLMGPMEAFPARLDPYSPLWVADALLALNLTGSAPIKLIIDSLGGMVDAGMTVYDTIKLSRAPVYTIARGDCCSMAVMVLVAGAKGHRLAYPSTRFMLHLPFSQVAGDSKEVAIRSRELTKTKDSLVNILRENGVDRTRGQILKDIDREYWMNAVEAISYGIIDRVVTQDDLIGGPGDGH